MRARTWSRLVGAAALLAPLTAYAEDAPPQYPACEGQPSETDVQGAKGAFQAGQASFEEGDYARAISYWEDAYRRDCTAHALLLNLARAYELNNQKLHAVNSLETFLARNPSSNQRDQIARRIEGLKAKIQEESQPKTSGGNESGSGNDEPSVGVDSGPTQPAGPKRPMTPLIVAGAGGVLTVVGGLLFLKARGDVKDIEDQCGGRACPTQDLIDEGNDARSRQTTWGIVTVGGIALAAGGLAWYFTSEPKPAQTALRTHKPLRRTRIDPVVGFGFTGVSVSGAF